MAFFDLFKRHRAKVSDCACDIQIEEPHVVEVVAKKRIADFFNTDILNLKREDYLERVTLNRPELGIFYYVDGHCNGDEFSTIEFVSLSKKFSPELIEFINACAKTFGPTKNGEAEVGPRDHILLQKGLFSRLWKHIWIECGSDEDNGGLTAIRISIFSPIETGNLLLDS